MLQAGRPQFSTYFTRDEFAGRRTHIAETIGAKAVALVQGAEPGLLQRCPLIAFDKTR